MDAVAAPGGIALEPGYISLSALPAGAAGIVVGVGSGAETLSPLHRRLLEFGFCSGEHVEILAEARPGRDPFVVRVGNTTLALRRCEAEHIWVDISPSIAASRPPCPPLETPQRVDISPSIAASRPPYPPLEAPQRVDISAPVSRSQTSVGPSAVEISRSGKSL